MNTKNKIALLCDYGLDDAIATLYLFKYADRFEQIDIVPVAGNFPLDITYINAKRVLSAIPSLPSNIRIVNTQSIKQNCEAIFDIHGNDGMGDIFPAEHKDSFTEITYEEWVSKIDSDYTVISLGPCTVTADILARKPQIELILMAGNISEEPNYNGYEFNHGINPEAFAFTVKHPHVVATLDTCHNPLCNLNNISFSQEGAFGDAIARYKALSNSRNEQICSIYDMMSIVYLVSPERFDVKEMTDPQGNKLNVLVYTDDKPVID